jgi:pimeloyl-ACP methyl ester carboxylesterase
VLGAGPPDLVYVNGLTEHIDLQWDHPLMARFLERLASFSRLIMFDRRGAGASDPVPLDALPTWEEWTEDLRAVLDAVGSERAAIYAELDAGPVGMIFAATHPERTAALVLGNTAARYAQAEDYPEGATPEAVAQIVELFRATWGTEQLIAMVFPSMASDPGFLRWRARFTRALATPRTAAAQYRYIFGMDVRSVLATIAVPTLVLHRSNFSIVPIGHGRYLADHIPGARLVEVAGGDAWFFTEGADQVLDEVAEFLTGSGHRPRPTGCWPRCCSATSSAPPNRRRGWGPQLASAAGRPLCALAGRAGPLRWPRGRHHWGRLLRGLRRSRPGDQLRMCDAGCDPRPGDRDPGWPAHRGGRDQR